MQAIKQFFKTHPHAWWGAYLPVYLAMFFTIEHFITDNYWATQTVLDTYIPSASGSSSPMCPGARCWWCWASI